MKATIEVPDQLYRRVKAKSALEGRPIRAIVTELLADWLEGRRPLPSPSDEEPEIREGHPSWFGSLRKYARPDMSHDMDTIRGSIDRARQQEGAGSRKEP